jgi:hypothetical protein
MMMELFFEAGLLKLNSRSAVREWVMVVHDLLAEKRRLR